MFESLSPRADFGVRLSEAARGEVSAAEAADATWLRISGHSMSDACRPSSWSQAIDT